jgi:GMP synthase-like glutamine amidotransferase
MPRAVVLINVPHEGPGLLGELLVAQGWGPWLVEAHAGERWPDDLGPADLLVVMGGPMGVGDLADPAYPWLAPVVALLRARLAVGAPNLGVCLGAQLLAHAAGAAVAPMVDAAGRRVREVGWGSLRVFPEADPCVAGLPAEIEVLHWHGDACALPVGATLLASTPACPVQMFRLGRSLGLQFHPEVDGPTACLWAAEDAAFVAAANGPEGVAALQAASPAAARRTEAVRRRLLTQGLRAILG